ncbi:MAG: tetratricopeptide repeat protein [Bacteroidota bacterium]
MARKSTNFLFICFIFGYTFSLAAQDEVDSLRSLLQTQAQDSNRIKSSLLLYEELKYENPDEATSYLNDALELSKKIEYQKGVIKSYLALGDFLETNSIYDSSLTVLLLAEKMSRGMNDRMLILDALSIQGKTLRSMSRWDEAIEVIMKGIDLAMEGQVDSATIVVNYNHLGNIYSDQNQFEEALDYYQKSISFMRNQERRKAITTMNIGLIHYRLEDYEIATEYFLNSLQVAQRIEAKLVIAHCYQKIGLVKRVTQEFEEAKKYYRLAIQQFQVVNDRSMLAYVHSNLAGIYSDEKNFDLAIEELLLSLSIQEEIEDRVGECYTLNNLGRAYKDLGDFQTAINYFSRSKKAAIEAGVLLINKDAAELLSEIYASRGDFEKAYSYHVEFKMLDDSTFNETKTSRIAELEEKYQNEQKQKEIELLNAENEIASLELKEQENLRNYLIVAAFLLVLLIGVVYNRYQLKAKANIKLKELDSLKTNFFTNISHEFRTPLTLILSPLQNLLKQETSSKRKEALAVIHRNAAMLTELTNQLLDLSKLEAGELDLHVAKQDFKAFVKVLIASFESLAVAQKVEFVFKIEEAPKEAFFDQDKVQKILNNLLSNAFKFTSTEGTVSLRIEQKNNLLCISVTDTGKGISTADQKLIFKRFHQNKDNTSSAAGTGIGLTLSKELALLHKGDITVESEPSQGATFTLQFPISKSAYLAKEIVEGELQERQIITKPALIPVEQETPEPEGATEKIVLVVEDNPDLRNHMTSLLESDFTVKQSIDGKAGIEDALKLVPDVIVTDLMMPKVDGVELCNTLKVNEKTSHIPIIMLTAKADRGTKLDGLKTGADDFLTKPFDNEELFIRVQNLIAQREKLQAKYEQTLRLAPSKITVKSPEETFIKNALEVVDQNLSNSEFTVEAFQKEMGMSRMQLHRKLKALTNFSASEFIRDIRLQRAEDLLIGNGLNVTEVAYSCGFNSVSYFTQCFRQKFGKSPSNYEVV